MTKTTTLAAVAVLAAAFTAAPAAARPTRQQQQAKQLYEAGTQHFNLGEYDAAVTSYKEAYRLVPEPYFLYNIAQSYRLAGDARQALSFYKSFLNALPEAPNRADVEGFITELEETLRQQEAAKSAAPTAPVSPSEPPKLRLPRPLDVTARPPREERSVLVLPPTVDASHAVYKKWWFWAGVGVIAAGATTMAVMSGGESPPSSDLGNFPVF